MQTFVLIAFIASVVFAVFDAVCCENYSLVNFATLVIAGTPLGTFALWYASGIAPVLF